MNEENKKIVQIINQFRNTSEVILYSEKPGLVIELTNSITPQFTSPYVTVGLKAQNSVVETIKNNPSAVIYLGDRFTTFDGIDIRSRVPIVFRYLAENYELKEFQGQLFAVPDTGKHKNNLLFSDFDMQHSPIFFAKYFKDKFLYSHVSINCDSVNNAGKYRFNNTNNYFYATLRCGDNLLPQIYFLGDALNFERVLL